MKIFFMSFGCDKNLVDSENMLGLLTKEGFDFTEEAEKADIIVVNTCCFINDAKEESINSILEMAEYKKDKCKVLIVTGCLAQRYQKEIRKEIAQVDACLGTNSYDKIVKAVKDVLDGQNCELYNELNTIVTTDAKRIVTTGGHFAYLKISEGCDKHCTYCIIPKIRGSYRSVPIEQLIKEASELVEDGVKELILVAQETTLYGVDLYGKKSLPLLLEKLNEIPKLRWIRILYCYPEEIDDELIDAIKNNSKVCHYIDMPVQHADDTILKRMGRRTNRQELLNIIGKLRKEIPDIALRTTLISGFPGETDEQHETLKEFVDIVEFDRLGVFTYSPEEDTPAATMDNQIDEEVKENRRCDIMELQQDIAFEKTQNCINEELWVMIEGKLPEENAYVGRTYKDAPEVDGYIFVNTANELMSGDFVKVRVIGAYEYDLIGEIIDEFTK